MSARTQTRRDGVQQGVLKRSLKGRPRKPRYDAIAGFFVKGLKMPLRIGGAVMHHLDVWKTDLQHLSEVRIDFDGEKLRSWREVFQNDLGDSPGSGAKFNDDGSVRNLGCVDYRQSQISTAWSKGPHVGGTRQKLLQKTQRTHFDPIFSYGMRFHSGTS